ncbi:MAG: quinone-dependent dihydroorotate dehydrogenase [Pseudomonadales bacterium]
MYKQLRPLLFSLNPEVAHDLTLGLLGVAGNSGLAKRLLPAPIDDPIELLGCRFSNRVGLAAGLDKNAACVKGMEALGFGFIEVGTVTPKPQPGNDKPRMFRLSEHEAIINRMGFNNQGLSALTQRVAAIRKSGLSCPLGINIGKNKLTTAEHAADDYTQCLTAVAHLADYVTINLSSPNTPGLRDLQFGDELQKLLTAIVSKRSELADQSGRRVPLLVKIAPDMAHDDLLSVADQLQANGIDGIIATNTTIDKQSVKGHKHCDEAGGLSGRVLFEKSTEIVATLSQHLGNEMVIVGVGGINSPEQAVAKIAAGADLVQLYSGLIYQGPSLIRRSASAICDAQCES